MWDLLDIPESIDRNMMLLLLAKFVFTSVITFLYVRDVLANQVSKTYFMLKNGSMINKTKDFLTSNLRNKIVTRNSYVKSNS